MNLMDWLLHGLGRDTINGKTFRCGSFTLPDDASTDYTVSHGLGSTPSAAFVWVVNPPYDSLYNIIGKFRADSTSENNSLSVLTYNGILAAGSSYAALNMGWTDESLIIRCSSQYNLISGVTYQWLVIA